MPKDLLPIWSFFVIHDTFFEVKESTEYKMIISELYIKLLFGLVVDGPRYLKKVVVLTDRGTYSAGSFTALGTKAIPNMVLIGDTTGGGLGMPNGGQLPNGWTYRFSITQSLTLDKKPDYENGVPADIPVSFDWSDLTKDEILEAAIAELQ